MMSGLIHLLIIQLSYLGLFLAGLISSSSIFVGIPPLYVIVFFSQALHLNPVIASIAAGTGSAIGELTGYLVGLGGSVLIKKKTKPLVRFFKKYGFAAIAVTAFLPFPFDVVGILSGLSKYDVKKFLLATAIGKIAKCLLIAYTGSLITSYLSAWLL